MYQQDIQTTDAEQSRRRTTEEDSQTRDDHGQPSTKEIKKTSNSNQRRNVWKEEYAPW